MDRWIDCTISEGQFTGEFAVQGKMFDSTDFSMFAPKEVLRFEEEPTKNKRVQGSIQVTLLEQKDDLSLIALPRPTFENGRTITVKTSQIR
ncbi:MAG: hypothetical protein OEW48_01440 [Phycisphaerae bacterium]|nr:hypothetical protein [Phycisphaerae bacterium]